MERSFFQWTDIFWKLIKTHFYIVQQELVGKIVNFYIWAFCSLIVMGYIMQDFGLASNYGSFQLATIIATVGLFEVYGNSVRAIVDFEGDRHISYLLTLPVSPSIVFWSMIISYTAIGIILSLVMLPFGKLLLWNTFSFETISWGKFLLILFLGNLFYSIFTIAITAHVGALSKMENVWSRFIFPMWFLGGFQFSWLAMYKLSPTLAYVLLSNPILFIMEGSRAAVLGQANCLPWEICCVVLVGFIILGWLYARCKMKRLLDFV